MVKALLRCVKRFTSEVKQYSSRSGRVRARGPLTPLEERSKGLEEGAAAGAAGILALSKRPW
jgi:hypothetical protein